MVDVNDGYREHHKAAKIQIKYDKIVVYNLLDMNDGIRKCRKKEESYIVPIASTRAGLIL